MSISIEIARPLDLDDLIEVARVTYLETYDLMGDKPKGITQLYVDQAFVPEKILPSLESAGAGPSTYLISRCDGQVAGYALITSSEIPDFVPNKNAIYFSGVYVLKTFRGRGIGKLLFERRKSLAKERGFTGAWLSVWALNELAVRFHVQRGFKTVGRQDWCFEAHGKKWMCEDLIMYQDI